MYPSQEITLYILKGMSQLTELNAVEYNQQEKEMQMKALKFVDKQIQSDYEALQKIKNWQKNEISPLEIEISVCPTAITETFRSWVRPVKQSATIRTWRKSSGTNNPSTAKEK